jgi:hypothetical protein
MIIRNSENHLKSLAGKPYEARIYNRSAALVAGEIKPVYISHRVNAARGGRYANSIDRTRFLESIWQPMRERARGNVQRNAATGYDAATLSPFIAETMLDIQRLADDMVDHSDTLYNIISRPEAGPEVKLRDLLPFIGKAKEFGGTGDLPPLMEHRLGVIEEVAIKLFGFGDKSMLREILWSPDYDQVANSAARVIADERNALLFKPMVGSTYDGNHSVPFDTTTGLSPDEQLYLTIKAAWKKLIGLKNPLTNKLIQDSDFETTLYVSKADSIDVQPIVEGELAGVGGTRIISKALPIDNFVEYSGGLNNGAPYQGEDLKYPGIQSGVAYLAAKAVDGAQLVKKIDWNMEIDPGSSQIKGEERYWWTAFGVYNENVLPATQGNDYFGAIVKIALA